MTTAISCFKGFLEYWDWLIAPIRGLTGLVFDYYVNKTMQNPQVRFCARQFSHQTEKSELISAIFNTCFPGCKWWENAKKEAISRLLDERIETTITDEEIAQVADALEAHEDEIIQASTELPPDWREWPAWGSPSAAKEKPLASASIPESDEKTESSQPNVEVTKDTYVEEREAKKMLEMFLTAPFVGNGGAESSDYEIGVLVSRRLIPPNVAKFEAEKIKKIENINGRIKTTHTKTNFTIHLSEPQNTTLTENGRNFLAKTYRLGWLGRKALEYFNINIANEIDGTIDHIKNEITFAPNRITGDMSGRVPQTLLSVKYNQESQAKLTVTLAPCSNPSASYSQDWTKEDFEGTFGDLIWPTTIQPGQSVE